MHEIIPSPGTAVKNWQEMEGRIRQVLPYAKSIHIDVVDGKFADNTTFADPEPFKQFTNDTCFEVHLMVDDPLKHVARWAKAGFRRFIGHIEKMPDQAAFVAKVEQIGEVGLAIDGPTAVDSLNVPLIDLDCVLIMAITAGFSGQQFTPTHLEKVKKLREQDELIPIEIDGGITDTTITLAKNMGATRFVATSFLFNADDIGQQLQKLTAAVSNT